MAVFTVLITKAKMHSFINSINESIIAQKFSLRRDKIKVSGALTPNYRAYLERDVMVRHSEEYITFQLESIGRRGAIRDPCCCCC